ncbi:MAG: hypothetical protein KDI83_07975, partial [Gammaproteobacteria bacterium]|nr:hypothetical protein [Gammaproteobacteria bacterium]
EMQEKRRQRMAFPLCRVVPGVRVHHASLLARILQKSNSDSNEASARLKPMPVGRSRSRGASRWILSAIAGAKTADAQTQPRDI